MAFLVGGANSASTGDFITNSLRFNDDDSPSLNKTFSTGNRKTFTFSTWVKRANITGSNTGLFAGATDSSNRFAIMFVSDNLYIQDRASDSNTFTLHSNNLFRDPSAWYHIVVAIDTTQGTEANRVKAYVNNTQITSFSSASYPNQNLDLQGNNNVFHVVGARTSDGSSGTNFLDGYMSDTYFVDGSAEAPTEFGETNDNGVWIPKKADVTFGTNGFRLEFKQTGTGTASASTIGADTSGEDNHLTSTNLAAIDITTDTPMNNFATFNSIYASNTQTNGYVTTLSEGNCQAASSADGKSSGVSSMGVANGKWYAEFKQTASSHSNNYAMVGVHGDIIPMLHNNPDGNGVLGYSPHGYGYWGYNATTSDGYKMNDDSSSTYGSPYTTNDIIGLAIDLDNGAMYVSKNGTWQASSDPTSGASKTNAIYALPDASTKPDGFYFMVVGDTSSSQTCTFQANFGNPPFAISSGNADANGYGNFEYAVPSGFYSLCTKNLAEYG